MQKTAVDLVSVRWLMRWVSTWSSGLYTRPFWSVEGSTNSNPVCSWGGGGRQRVIMNVQNVQASTTFLFGTNDRFSLMSLLKFMFQIKQI